MSLEVHIDLEGRPHLVGRLHVADRGSSISFEYALEWLQRAGTFAIDPTSLPLQRGVHHGRTLFGAIQDCGPDRWGRILIERAVRKKVLAQKPYHDIDYVLALDDASRIGALRFRVDTDSPFLAPTSGKLPPLVRLNTLLRATDAIHSETETAQDLRFLLGAGSPLGGARPKAAVSLTDARLALAKFPKPDDTRDIAAGEILALRGARFQVYESRQIGLAPGDMIRITQNGFTRDGKRLNNGDLKQVKEFTKEGDIKLSNGWVIAKDYGNLAHGYCVTSYGSQSKGVDCVFVAESSQSFRAADREQFYVSASRFKDALTIYTNDKAALLDAVNKTSHRPSAMQPMKANGCFSG